MKNLEYVINCQKKLFIYGEQVFIDEKFKRLLYKLLLRLVKKKLLLNANNINFFLYI
jgi:hypothetical protein